MFLKNFSELIDYYTSIPYDAFSVKVNKRPTELMQEYKKNFYSQQSQKSSEKEYIYTFQHAGINPEDISIEILEGNILKVSTKEVTKSFLLNQDADTTKIEAESKYGLLTIKVAKKSQPEAQKVSIKILD